MIEFGAQSEIRTDDSQFIRLNTAEIQLVTGYIRVGDVLGVGV